MYMNWIREIIKIDTHASSLLRNAVFKTFYTYHVGAHFYLSKHVKMNFLGVQLLKISIVDEVNRVPVTKKLVTKKDTFNYVYNFSRHPTHVWERSKSLILPTQISKKKKKICKSKNIKKKNFHDKYPTS